MNVRVLHREEVNYRNSSHLNVNLSSSAMREQYSMVWYCLLLLISRATGSVNCLLLSEMQKYLFINPLPSPTSMTFALDQQTFSKVLVVNTEKQSRQINICLRKTIYHIFKLLVVKKKKLQYFENIRDCFTMFFFFSSPHATPLFWGWLKKTTKILYNLIFSFAWIH